MSLPIIGEDLKIREDQLQWPISAYSLSAVSSISVVPQSRLFISDNQGCLLILLGRIADLYGRRKIFIVGCVLQGAFSLGSGFAKGELELC